MRTTMLKWTLLFVVFSLALLLPASGGTAQAATGCVNPGGTGGCFASIQVAINAAAPGDVITIAPGTYRENVTVTKPVTLAGAGVYSIVQPAVSNPNPCPGSSLCGGTASNIMLVQADNVTIHDLTLDGDNPLLTSGIVRGGADLDARNGIITNHPLGRFDNLTIYNVTVKNVYLRGIYASSGGSFNFHDNTVQNVQGDYYSIGMFNFGGAGAFVNNQVSYANDAISANWSRGTQFLNNRVANSGSGVHTDNSGTAGFADVIRGNTVWNCMAGGYGVFVFVPYMAPVVDGNSILRCSVGLAAFGSAQPLTTAFTNNTVNGANLAGSTGVYATDDQLGYGCGNTSALFTGNTVQNNTTGFDLEQTTCSLSVALSQNNIKGNGTGVYNNTTTAVNASGNWWGCPQGPGAPGCDTIVNARTGSTIVSPNLKRPIQSTTP
ncbi:MAG TPA: hypothetical protein VF932_16195 [Anaerolineae bacterium]